jgi:hypothetical protein
MTIECPYCGQSITGQPGDLFEHAYRNHGYDPDDCPCGGGSPAGIFHIDGMSRGMWSEEDALVFRVHLYEVLHGVQR